MRLPAFARIYQAASGDLEIRAKVAVFYGKVDQKRDPGWYWTRVPGPGEPLKGPYSGPFETKAEAVEDANQAAVIEEKGPGVSSTSCGVVGDG